MPEKGGLSIQAVLVHAGCNYCRIIMMTSGAADTRAYNYIIMQLHAGRVRPDIAFIPDENRSYKIVKGMLGDS